MTDNKDRSSQHRQDQVELSELEHSRGVQVIQTTGFPDGYTPPSASLTPPPPAAPRDAVADTAPSIDQVISAPSGNRGQGGSDGDGGDGASAT